MQGRLVELRFGHHEVGALLGFGSADRLASGTPSSTEGDHVRGGVEAGIAAGFQLATSTGPLCDEPLWGVAFEASFICLLMPLSL